MNGKPEIVPDYAKVRPFESNCTAAGGTDALGDLCRCKASSSASSLRSCWLSLSLGLSKPSIYTAFATTYLRACRNHGSHFEKNKIAFQEGAAAEGVILDDEPVPAITDMEADVRASGSEIDEKHRSMEKV